MNPDDLLELAPDTSDELLDPVNLVIAPPPSKPASGLAPSWDFHIPGILKKTLARNPDNAAFSAVLKEECGKVNPMSQDKIYDRILQRIKELVAQKKVSVPQAIQLLIASK